MKRQAILAKYMVFLMGCGLVLAGFTSWLANPNEMQIVFSALAAILGALLVTLGLSKPPTIETKNETADEKLAKDVMNEEDQIDSHNEFHATDKLLDEIDCSLGKHEWEYRDSESKAFCKRCGQASSQAYFDHKKEGERIG